MIELLAVIIILGVLMLIAVPSVTEYITKSRRSVYLSTATGFADSVSKKVASSSFVDSTWPWLQRGGPNNTLAGIFNFDKHYGATNSNCTFRIVIAI